MRFSLWQGTKGTRVDDAAISATITAAVLGRFIRDAGVRADVELEPGTIVLRGVLPMPVRLGIEVDGGELRLVPRVPLLAVLPLRLRIPYVHLDAANVEPAGIALRATVTGDAGDVACSARAALERHLASLAALTALGAQRLPGRPAPP